MADINKTRHLDLNTYAFAMGLRDSAATKSAVVVRDKVSSNKPIPKTKVPQALLGGNVKIPNIVKEIRCKHHGCQVDNAELANGIYERLEYIEKMKEMEVEIEEWQVNLGEVTAEHTAVLQVQHRIEDKLNILSDRERITLVRKQDEIREERKQLENEIILARQQLRRAKEALDGKKKLAVPKTVNNSELIFGEPGPKPGRKHNGITAVAMDGKVEWTCCQSRNLDPTEGGCIEENSVGVREKLPYQRSNDFQANYFDLSRRDLPHRTAGGSHSRPMSASGILQSQSHMNSHHHHHHHSHIPHHHQHHHHRHGHNHSHSHALNQQQQSIITLTHGSQVTAHTSASTFPRRIRKSVQDSSSRTNTGNGSTHCNSNNNNNNNNRDYNVNFQQHGTSNKFGGLASGSIAAPAGKVRPKSAHTGMLLSSGHKTASTPNINTENREHSSAPPVAATYQAYQFIKQRSFSAGPMGRDSSRSGPLLGSVPSSEMEINALQRESHIIQGNENFLNSTASIVLRSASGKIGKVREVDRPNSGKAFKNKNNTLASPVGFSLYTNSILAGTGSQGLQGFAYLNESF